MPANPFQDGVSVEVQGDSSGLDDALTNASAGLTDFKKKVGLAGGALAALAGGAMAGAINEARKFEDAMADVQKVTSEEMAGELHDEIMSMSEDIPIAQTELAKLAEQAGKFGAESTEEITTFVEAVGKIQTATDLAADEAGKRFAKIAGALGIPLTQIDKLGNGVNALADSMKTDADEITDVATRVSNTLGQQLGLGEDAVLALSASMNEVSPSAELAASSLRRATEVLMNPKKVSDIADALGMSVDEFRSMRDENPHGLINEVAMAMNENGQAASSLRADIGKAATDFSKLGTQLDRTEDAQKTVNQQFKNGTSLQKEMGIRTNTFSGRVQLLQNKLRNVAITIGEQLLPPTIKFIDFVTRAVDAFSRWNQKTNGLMGALTLVGTAIGGLLTVVGVLINAVGGVASIMAFASTASGALGTALTLLTGPIGLAVAAIAALGIAWKKNLFGIRDHTRNALEAVQNAIGRVLSWISSQWAEHGSRITSEAKKTWDAFAHHVRNAIKIIRTALGPFLSWMSSEWDKHGDKIISTVEFAFDAIKGQIEWSIDGITTIIVAALRVLRGDWTGAWNAIKGFLFRTLDGILDFVDKWDIRDKVLGAVRSAQNAIRNMASDFLQAGESLIDAFINGIENKANEVGRAVNDAVENARNMLPDSDAKEGPLSDLTDSGAALPETFAKGIDSNLKAVRDASVATAQAAAPSAQASGGGSQTMIKIDVDARGASDPDAVAMSISDEFRSVLPR